MKQKSVRIAVLGLATMTASVAIAQETAGVDDGPVHQAPYRALNPRTDFLIIGEACFGFLPPVSPAAGEVNVLSWSPDGERLIVSTSETPSSMYRSYLTTEEVSPLTVKNLVTMFDLKSGASRVVLRGGALVSYGNLQWRGDGQMAFVEERRTGEEQQSTTLHCIHLDGRVTSLQLAAGLGSISCDEKSNLVAAVRADPQKGPGRTSRTICVLDKSMRFVPLKTPEGYLVTTFGIRQGDKGLIVLLSPLTGEPEYGRIDPTTLAIEVLPKSSSGYSRVIVLGGIHFNSRLSEAGAIQLIAHHDPELPGKATPIVVAQEAELFWEAPKDNAIAYTSKGLLLVREIVQMDKKVYDKMLAAKEREAAMIRCKNVAMALLMYAADHEDSLPTANADEELLPYLKNKSALDGFVFTFQGKSLADVKEPHKTEIGYVRLEGGRCVTYADGHVSWVPDKN